MIQAIRSCAPFGAAFAAALVAGCTSMLATSQYQWAESFEQKACSAGAYHLPRKVLHLRVKLADPPELEFDPAQHLKSIADSRLPLCLDYLAAPTADDTIAIKRTPDGLLQKINANADDKSLEITTAVIDIARLSAVAAGSMDPARSLKVKDGSDFYAGPFQMDPFDPSAAASINDRLKDLGYCVYVEGHTFDPTRMKPETYCRDPRLGAKHEPQGFAIDPAAVIAESRRGVLYRQNEPYRVVVMERPKGGGWRRSRTYAVDMPNVAPIFSVGVDRTFFALRKTSLTFDDGVLQNVEIEKGSELNAIAEVPLRLAQAIVAVPAQIVQVRINRVNNQRALINAQADLIKTYHDFNTARRMAATSLGNIGSLAAERRKRLEQECENEDPEKNLDPSQLQSCVEQKILEGR